MYNGTLLSISSSLHIDKIPIFSYTEWFVRVDIKFAAILFHQKAYKEKHLDSIPHHNLNKHLRSAKRTLNLTPANYICVKYKVPHLIPTKER